MTQNNIGQIINDVWNSLPTRYPIILDQFQIMPNHIHGIINIKRAHRDAPLRRTLISQIVGYLKMNSTKQIHQKHPNIQIWQRNYFEYIIRDEADLFRIRQYIESNPENWQKDKLFIS